MNLSRLGHTVDLGCRLPKITIHLWRTCTGACDLPWPAVCRNQWQADRHCSCSQVTRHLSTYTWLEKDRCPKTETVCVQVAHFSLVACNRSNFQLHADSRVACHWFIETNDHGWLPQQQRTFINIIKTPFYICIRIYEAVVQHIFILFFYITIILMHVFSLPPWKRLCRILMIRLGNFSSLRKP